MDRLISEQEVLDVIASWFESIEQQRILQGRIKAIPSAEPKTGHWKRISMDRYTTHAQYWYECDKCGEHNLGNTDWCPNCGCRMIEPQEGASE